MGFSLVAASRGLLFSYDAPASHRGGFSCCGAQALGAQASVVAVHALSFCGSWVLEHRLNTCGARAKLLLCIWHLSRHLFRHLLHWQVDSLPLSHQGSPITFFFKEIFVYLAVPELSCSMQDLSVESHGLLVIACGI